jgi:hypothetical protein
LLIAKCRELNRRGIRHQSSTQANV